MATTIIDESSSKSDNKGVNLNQKAALFELASAHETHAGTLAAFTRLIDDSLQFSFDKPNEVSVNVANIYAITFALEALVGKMNASANRGYDHARSCDSVVTHSSPALDLRGAA